MPDLLHQNLTASAAAYPDKAAYILASEQITYRDLNTQSNQIARYLLNNGFQKGDRVGVFLDKSILSPVAVYGVLKAGGVFVPIDPQSPNSRLSRILSLCEIRHVVSNARLIHQVYASDAPPSRIAWLCAESPSGLPEGVEVHTLDELSTLSESPPEAEMISTDDLAYIMFTSGSTGMPKGIMHTHASGIAHARSSIELYGLDEKDRIAGHAPLHFDISTMAYLTSPMVGATTIIIPDTYTKFPASLTQMLENEKVSIWYSVPFALIQILTMGAMEKRDLTAIRWVLYGGDPFSPRQVRELMDKLPDARFCNVYGPAETNQCTYYYIPDSMHPEDGAIPIGTPLREADFLILDSNDEQSNNGELLINAPTMMQGYWRQDELNKKCFFHDPESGKKYYRTGDLVSLDHDSILHYHGRMDRQIKVRGNRVELDDIENALTGMSEIREAAAYVLNPGTEKELIEASISATEDQYVDLEKCQDYLSSRLPRYAIPGQFNLIQHFPRTGSGKIDRRALQSQRQNKISEH